MICDQTKAVPISRKALQLAQKDVTRIITECAPALEQEAVASLADKLLQTINWDDPILMHKSIAWITHTYLHNQILL